MTQTLAIFKDAYRELNHKKLFWIVMSCSVAVVAALAILANNEKGISAFGLGVDFPLLSTRVVSRAGFYKFLLYWIGNNLWLTWGAAALALISTAGMIPDMVAGGSIDLTLSRPIGRLRLFLTKYLSGLLFVLLQTLVFSLGAILLLGLRAGSWELRPLLAVPIVTIFYSYTYCVCALVGLITRSTLAALLTAVVFLLFAYAVTTTEHILLDQRMQREREVSRIQTQMDRLTQSLSAIDARLGSNTAAPDAATSPASPADDDDPSSSLAPSPDDSAAPPPAASASGDRPSPPPPPTHRRPRGGVRGMLAAGQAMLDGMKQTSNPAELKSLRADLARQRDQLERKLPDVEDEAAGMRTWHRRLYIAATVLPKTSETKRLFQRYVVGKEDQEGFLKFIAEQSGDPGNRALEDVLNQRSLLWVLGTSLGFEAVVLALACWIFARRDF